MTVDLDQITAAAAAEALRDGSLTSEELVSACLKRIEEKEPSLKAWAHLDPEHALAQARAADGRHARGEPKGPLHGLPVGVKDIFDTRDFPTEDGTVLHAGRTPDDDATAVALLRAAGAVILGKTVTTELAVYSPGPTANPHDPARTPGGSSSGSAAAVAAGMVPLAIGTQTNGSVIRPAAYCGVVGFKPSHGAIPRHRILALSRWLDQVGVFARSVEDAALLAESLFGFDERDPDTRPRARPRLVETAREAPPVRPHFAFVRTPVWDQADASTRQAFEELVEYLGEDIEEIRLPSVFDHAVEWHRRVMEADLARSLVHEYEKGRDKLSPVLTEMIERGRTVTAVEYMNAVGLIDDLRQILDEDVFDRCDAVVTPATTGEAPKGLDSTGSPIFCTLWTFCGTPAVSLPLMQGPAGMPLGVQLVGRKGDDARLLRTGRWLAAKVASGDDDLAAA